MNRIISNSNTVVVAFTTQEAKEAYGAVSDVAQLLKHVDNYATDELLLKRKWHGNTLYGLSERKLFDALPLEVQDEMEKQIDFCK